MSKKEEKPQYIKDIIEIYKKHNKLGFFVTTSLNSPVELECYGFSEEDSYGMMHQMAEHFYDLNPTNLPDFIRTFGPSGDNIPPSNSGFGKSNKNKITQCRPSFFEGFENEVIEFNTLEELLNIEWVKSFSTMDKTFTNYSIGSFNKLIAEYFTDEGRRSYLVIGTLENDIPELPRRT